MSEGQARRIFSYGLARGIAEGLLAVRGLLLAALLGPSGFGVWTLFRIASRYLGLPELALRRGMEYEAARAVDIQQPGPKRGKRQSSAVPLGRAAVAFLVRLYGTIGVAAFLASFFVVDPGTVLVLRALGLTLLAERLWLFALAYMRSTGGLRRLAIFEVTGATLHLLLVAILAVRWGLVGALAGFALACFANVALVRPHVPLRPAISTPLFRRMLRVGLPFGITIALALGFHTVDRLVVAAFGGTTLLGYYALAVSFGAMAASGASVMRTIVFPEVYRGAGHSGGVQATAHLIEDTILPFALAYPALLGLASFAIGPTIRYFLPEYESAVWPATIMLFAGVGVGLSDLGSVGLVAVSRERVLPALAAVALVFNLALSVGALQLGLGITAVAAGALLSRVGYGMAVLGVAAAASGSRQLRRVLGRSILPLAYTLALVVALQTTMPGRGGRSTLISALAYVVLLGPLFPAARREFHRRRQDG